VSCGQPRSTKARRLRVIVLGGGIAGSAIAAELAGGGAIDVDLVPGTAAGSTASNQRWLHSGLLYRTRPTARAMWSSHRETRSRWPTALYGPGSASFIVRDPSLKAALSQRWSGWQLGTEGPHAVEDEAGFRTPDRVIDFPCVASRMIAGAQAAGAMVRSGRTAISIDTDRPGSVKVRLDDDTVLNADHCIVAAGAWSVGLLRPIGIEPPVLLRRCAVVRFATELVPKLTVWLDARDGSAHSQDLSLTPFHGMTIGAEPDGDVVDVPDDLEGLATRAAELVSEYADLISAAAKELLVSFNYCVKIERATGDSRVAMGVFSANTDALDWPDRLTLAFPGKATLAGRLGREVLDDLQASSVHEQHFAYLEGNHHA
jgi:glycine/D-amino acid oxidase-like deaminating enzyme